MARILALTVQVFAFSSPVFAIFIVSSSNSFLEFKLECGYLRVPLKRGKASQTYIESAKERKAAAAAAAAAAASGEPPSTETSSNGKAQKPKIPKPPSLITTSSQDKSLQNISASNSEFPQYKQDPKINDPDLSSTNSEHSTDSGFPDPAPTTTDPLGPILFHSSEHINSNKKSRSASINPEYSMDTPNLIFDQAMSPDTGWLLNLVSPSMDSQPQPAKVSITEPSKINRAHNFLERDHNFSEPGYSNITQVDHLPQSLGYQQVNQIPQVNQVNQNIQMIHASQGSAGPPRYPILKTIEHTITPFPMSLMENLLESYFSHNTHLLAHIVRKSSILSSTAPRRSSPALIYSFLLVAAHYSDNPLVSGTPSARENIIRRLTDLTISNLTTAHQVTPAVGVDDIIAYIHLGTIVSASEYKGSSLRFWAAAWALSKELKLAVENPDLPEETREERRRTWWLLYMVDRHLGLCYNRPLAILDSESNSVYRPIDDDLWLSDATLTPAELDPTRIKGLCHYVTGQGIFGYFLPLMTILGSLLELHHFQQNPVLPLTDVNRGMKAVIRSHLEQYTTSLKNWNSVPCAHIYENAWRDYAFQLSHVMHILALIPWDPLELINSLDSLILSPEFTEATSHAISASKHTRRILTMDTDLMLMPFFFGIYLLQSSFILLFIVDRVESEASHDVFAACETIVHAHEVCVVTLNTEYQRNFRRVMRGTINLLNSNAAHNNSSGSPSLSPPMGMNDLASKQIYEEQLQREKEEARKRRKDVLGLYRWSSGGHGLAV